MISTISAVILRSCKCGDITESLSVRSSTSEELDHSLCGCSDGSTGHVVSSSSQSRHKVISHRDRGTSPGMGALLFALHMFLQVVLCALLTSRMHMYPRLLCVVRNHHLISSRAFAYCVT